MDVLLTIAPRAISKYIVRTFKTKGFAKDAKKAGISDDELCKAIAEVREGKGDDLGGGVWKKRLNNNEHRSIVLMKGGERWFYQYLFAKKDRANIEQDELADFKTLAKDYDKLTDDQITKLIKGKHLVEICSDDEEEI